MSSQYNKGCCQHCGNNIEFPAEAAGMTIDCPHCQQPTLLESVGDILSTPEATGPNAVEILAAFNGSIPKTPVSFGYQISLFVVAGMMLLLPVIYLGLIAGTAWGVYFYATHAYHIFSGGGGAIIKLLIYVTPLVMGCVMVLFMIKPLFAGRAAKTTRLALDPGANQTLFAFIAKISDLTGAPMPTRIDLDCQLNAAASFRRGTWSLFSNDLVLTIGLPLVAGLNTREFAGVIAHEFGHFTQGFGMRLSYVIRTVNAWFARVVFERDAWDMMLENMAEQAEDGRIAILIGMTRLGVWFSRFVLKVLMISGHVVSCFLLRQMEFDADSYEIKVAGSSAFESTVKRIRLLAEATGRAYKEMRSSWNLGKQLPDNVPAFLLHHETQIPSGLRDKISYDLTQEKTSLFETHPSDASRVERARKANDPGIFHLEIPASALFSNFEVVSQQVTQLHYADDIGIEVQPSMLRPLAAFRGDGMKPAEPAFAATPTRGPIKLKINKGS